MLANAGVGAQGSSAELSGPPVGPVRAGYGKEEGRKVRELGQQSRPIALEKREGRRSAIGPPGRPSQERKGEEGRARSWSWAENGRRRVFKMKFFSNSSFLILSPIQIKFKYVLKYISL